MYQKLINLTFLTCIFERSRSGAAVAQLGSVPTGPTGPAGRLWPAREVDSADGSLTSIDGRAARKVGRYVVFQYGS